jgi:tannase/feruloyl esterase
MRVAAVLKVLNAGAAVGIGLLGLMTTSASAQNGASFADASRAIVAYTETPLAATTSCGSLVSLTRYEYSVISAQTVAPAADVPEHCRVRGVIPPEIAFEVNLPLRWNGRLYMHGNGGFAGNKLDARPSVRARALRHGFATTHTNTGHDAEQEPGASFAHDNWQKTLDYAYRAVHLTALTAKQIAASFYGRPPERSYWDGCSNGGRQGLMSAQRFPDDFDGIVAGAPVVDFTGTMTAFLWNSRALRDAPLSREKLQRLGTEIYARCDRVDGLEDGLIDDPRRCEFDPAIHLPRCGSDRRAGATCFTAEEVAALQKIYQGPRAAGVSLYPGQPPGAEIAGLDTAQEAAPRLVNGWEPWLFNGSEPTAQYRMVDSFLKFLAFERDDPQYDPAAFRFDVDPPRMQATATFLNTTNPDLQRFRARGGKMITYFGWADSALNPLRFVQYYESVKSADGGTPEDFYRLFMVPGMFHCGGGIGAERFDAMTAVIDWVEANKAPARLVGQHVVQGSVKFTRPHCPYPQVARYKGSGPRHALENFICAVPQHALTRAAIR